MILLFSSGKSKSVDYKFSIQRSMVFILDCNSRLDALACRKIGIFEVKKEVFNCSRYKPMPWTDQITELAPYERT